jgi:hypothetical protein
MAATELSEQVVFAQISDLHFGAKLIEPFDASFHNPALCLNLPRALKTARSVTDLQSNQPLHIVVTGDLTNNGGQDQFAVAHTFLHDRIRLKVAPALQFMGVGSHEYLVTIPGNHDHWDGNVWRHSMAFTPAIAGLHFQATPWRYQWKSPSAKVRVSLFGVDSSSGLSPYATNRLAKGKISQDELKTLRDLLDEDVADAKKSGVEPVRTILCHHSISYYDEKYVLGPLRLEANELDLGSRLSLVSLAAEYGVRAILTGDSHRAYDGSLDDFNSTNSQAPYEIRSSATLTRESTETPGFWVHHIKQSTGVPSWIATRFDWTGQEFTPTHKVSA